MPPRQHPDGPTAARSGDDAPEEVRDAARRRVPRAAGPVVAGSLLALVLIFNAVTPRATPIKPYGRVVASACAMDQLPLIRISRGYFPGRSGDVVVVPANANFIATRGGSVTHGMTAIFDEHVPLVVHGPGIERELQESRIVSLASVGPTIAELVGFGSPDWYPVESPLVEAIASPPHTPPRLIVTVVWDGAGRNVLAHWHNLWPELARLATQGTEYLKASAGSAPPSTASSHATMGTGVYPNLHGVVDDFVRRPDGKVRSAAGVGPGDLRLPTLADLYDAAEGNRPVVAFVGTDPSQVAAIGHGASFPGGDRDIAAVHVPGAPADDWRLPAGDGSSSFELPDSLRHVAGFEQDVRALDEADGTVDGLWQGERIDSLDHGFDTPAAAAYETRVVERLVASEKMGRDEVPDLLTVNYSGVETAERRWATNAPQMHDMVLAQDQALAELVSFLDRTVGQDRWTLIVTADHGSTPPTTVTDSFAIDPTELEDDIQRRFGGGADQSPVVDRIGSGQIWMDVDRLRERGHTLQDVARYLLDYTESDNRPGAGDAKVFLSVFPSNALPTMPCLGS
jgi:arylsulfatase A-like enzyme